MSHFPLVLVMMLGFISCKTIPQFLNPNLLWSSSESYLKFKVTLIHSHDLPERHNYRWSPEVFRFPSNPSQVRWREREKRQQQCSFMHKKKYSNRKFLIKTSSLITHKTNSLLLYYQREMERHKKNREEGDDRTPWWKATDHLYYWIGDSIYLELIFNLFPLLDP